MKIGTIIKEKRTKSGLTQEDLAKKLHVSRSTISNWEINRNYPDIKLIVNISNILEIPLKELLQEESDIVNRLSEDTIIRKKISKRNKILYFLIFILLIILLSVVIYFSNINDISNKKEIVGAYISNEKLYIKTDLPKVRSAYDSKQHQDIDIKTVDQKALYDEIYRDFGFLIKANDKKPMINLQWLFNKKYYKRFN